MGVNRAVASVLRQEKLKSQYPPGERLRYRVATIELPGRSRAGSDEREMLAAEEHGEYRTSRELALIERAHPDLGRLGVFWHTQGSGKSYSMVFFAEKVRRVVPGNFTFVVMTDRDDLDDQIYRTFVGTAVCSEKTPRASSARANRVYPGKDCGIIVDYNGMFASLRRALADYAAADPDSETGDPLEPLEDRIAGLIDAIESAEDHLAKLGFDLSRFDNATGFDRIEAIKDAVEAARTTDEDKRRFEVFAMEVIKRFRALNMEPTVYQFAERRDNIEAIYRKLLQRRTVADVTDMLKELHKIVNEAIGTAGPGDDHADSLTLDLSTIDFEKLKEEFAKKGKRKHSMVQDIADLLEQKLQDMLERNPLRMDHYKKYQEIIADYNREKDRVTIEETFRRLLELYESLDEEDKRAAAEGLSDDELALFDLLKRDDLSKTDRETLKQASQQLLQSLTELLRPMQQWTQKEQTQAEVEVFILDKLFEVIPMPPYTEDDAHAAAERVYQYIWQRSAAGAFPTSAAA